ncbi:hypothetical protein [Priestia flexa]|uniref:hypothetical protein n=1 Tax=Priestia flexa TaxID=86664 RepID=UPI002E10FD91
MEVLEEDEGRPIAVRGKLEERQVSMKRLRQMTEEQRQLAAERLHNARNSKKL